MKMKLLRLGLLFGTLMFMSQLTFGQAKIGPGVAYGFDIKDIGLMVKGVIPVTDQIDASPSFTYFLSGSNTTIWTLDANAHYYFGNSEGFQLYALGGINIYHVDIDIINFDGITEWGLNIGVGLLYGLTDSFDLTGEWKYVLGDADQLYFSAGLLFDL